MAGRPFGSYDIPPIRSEANVDPFTTFVNNGMAPSGAAVQPTTTNPSSAPTATAGAATSPSGILPILSMLAPLLQKLQAAGKPGGAAAGLGGPTLAGSKAPQGAGNFGQGLGGYNAGAGNPLNSVLPGTATAPSISPGSNLGTLPGGQIGSLIQAILPMLTPSIVAPNS